MFKRKAVKPGKALLPPHVAKRAKAEKKLSSGFLSGAGGPGDAITMQAYCRLYNDIKGAKGGILLGCDFEGLQKQSFTEGGIVAHRFWTDDGLECQSTERLHVRTNHARRHSVLNEGKTRHLQQDDATFELGSKLAMLLSWNVPVIMLLHDRRGDSQILANVCHVDQAHLQPWQPGTVIAPGQIRVIDTQDVAKAFFGIDHQIGLQKACVALGVDLKNWHNAQNDATVTIHIFLKMLEAFELSQKPISPTNGKRAAKHSVIDLDGDDQQPVAPVVIDLDGGDEPMVLDAAAQRRLACLSAVMKRSDGPIVSHQPVAGPSKSKVIDLD